MAPGQFLLWHCLGWSSRHLGRVRSAKRKQWLNMSNALQLVSTIESCTKNATIFPDQSVPYLLQCTTSRPFCPLLIKCNYSTWQARDDMAFLALATLGAKMIKDACDTPPTQRACEVSLSFLSHPSQSCAASCKPPGTASDSWNLKEQLGTRVTT